MDGVMCICCCRPSSYSFIWVSAPQFSCGCCPLCFQGKQAQVPAPEGGPGWPKLVLTAQCPGLSDWQVSQGSICWEVLKRKLFRLFFPRSYLPRAALFSTGLGGPHGCWQPSCGQEGQAEAGGRVEKWKAMRFLETLQSC